MPHNKKTSSLQNLPLDKLKQNPLLSWLALYIPLLSRIIKIEPQDSAFINLLPIDIKKEILLFIPKPDWVSLAKVSQEWRNIVLSAAKNYLDSIGNHLTTLEATNFDSLINDMLQTVDGYVQRGGRRQEVKALKVLGEKLPDLHSPLAKLLWIDRRLTQVDKMIKSESGRFTLLGSSTYSNNPLFKIIAPIIKTCKEFTNERWVQDAIICMKLIPKHEFSKALIEVKALESHATEEITPNLRNVSELKLTRYL
ncbi:F-box protein [Legionella sp. CNM-1927-20]|uniref:F-box protein n=1 Tax=Legionella sp. CNM-1927-20 TaxID=3422221 RepID=UPI00403AC345